MKNIVLILILLFCELIKAQPPSKFYSTFGGDGDDIAYSGKQTLDRQYIVAGSSTSYGVFGNTDAYLIKVDSFGVRVWQKYIGGFGNDVAKSVIQLQDSGYVIAGFTNSFGAGGYDAFIVKTDKIGNTIWQKTFGGQDWDFAADLVLASDGNIVVVGNTYSFGSGKKDGFVIKYDLAGNLLWQKIIGGAENEEFRSVIKTNDNFLATVGYTESGNDINGDCYFVKLNLNGDTIFTKTFGGQYRDYANDVVQKNSGDYNICGAGTYTLNGYTESLMLCISDVGTKLWDRHLLKNNADEAFMSISNCSTLPDISAYTRSVDFPAFKRQGQIFTANRFNGFEYQINESGGLEDEYEYSVEATKDGGYLNVGYTTSFGSKGKDVYLIKRDSVVLYYSSIVGVKESNIYQRPSIFYEDKFLVLRDSEIELVEIIDLNGKLIDIFYPASTEFKIDISKYISSLYIINIRLKNGQVYHDKFISR